MEIYFIVPGPPKGKARARTLRNGITYTPKETVQYENLVKMYCKQAMSGAPIDGPVAILVEAGFPIPKSASQNRQKAMCNHDVYPTVKPDLDNILKIICDSLNGIAWRDDAQVVISTVWKYYSIEPCVTVMISEFSGGK